MPGYETYVAMMGILDYLALHNVEDKWKRHFYFTLDNLLDKFMKETDSTSTREDEIAGMSDGNDCGCVDNWEDFVKELKILWINNERVEVKRGN